ncbi:MAG: hypothetical protein LKF36_01175 [Lactobacillus sp.]|jgi:hypothetical protein|nr:hypothetical protein [Lactobacillus sp.]
MTKNIQETNIEKNVAQILAYLQGDTSQVRVDTVVIADTTARKDSDKQLENKDVK